MVEEGGERIKSQRRVNALKLITRLAGADAGTAAVSKSPTQDTGFRRRRRCCGDGREGDVFVVGKLMTERAAQVLECGRNGSPAFHPRERERVVCVLCCIFPPRRIGTVLVRCTEH